MDPVTEPVWFSGTTVIVPTASLSESSSVAGLIEEHLRGVRVRVGMAYALVEPHDPDTQLLDRVREVLASSRTGGIAPSTSDRVHTFDVHYDGADLAAVAGALDLSVDALITHHEATTWRVAKLGFAPGFGYLVAVEPSVDWTAVSRLDTPRRAVPNGSIGLAAGMSCIYPSGMPGGWPLLGRTEAVLFDPTNEADPTLLHPGDTVRFVRGDS